MSCTPTVNAPLGYINDTGDALLIFNAAILGKIPRITRRLTDIERQTMIRSGAVFVWNEEESTIKRWTDSLAWSQSRIYGNFLMYHETKERGAGRSPAARATKGSRVPRTSDAKLTPEELEQRMRKRSLFGSLEDDSGTFKLGGLIKKAISLKIRGNIHHLVSYYQPDDIIEGVLASFSSIPRIRALGIPPEMLDRSIFRYPPRVELVRGIVTYVGDASDRSIHPPYNEEVSDPSLSVAISGLCHPDDADTGNLSEAEPRHSSLRVSSSRETLPTRHEPYPRSRSSILLPCRSRVVSSNHSRSPTPARAISRRTPSSGNTSLPDFMLPLHPPTSDHYISSPVGDAIDFQNLEPYGNSEVQAEHAEMYQPEYTHLQSPPMTPLSGVSSLPSLLTKPYSWFSSIGPPHGELPTPPPTACTFGGVLSPVTRDGTDRTSPFAFSVTEANNFFADQFGLIGPGELTR